MVKPPHRVRAPGRLTPDTMTRVSEGISHIEMPFFQACVICLAQDPTLCVENIVFDTYGSRSKEYLNGASWVSSQCYPRSFPSSSP